MAIYSKYMTVTFDETIEFILLACKVLHDFSFHIDCRLISYTAGSDEYAGFGHLVIYDTLRHKCLIDNTWVSDESLECVLRTSLLKSI